MHNSKEYTLKLERLRGMMESENLAACYIKRQDNFAWLTGGRVNALSPAAEVGNCGLLVTMDKVYAITNVSECQRMIDEEQLPEYGIIVKSATWHQDSFEGDTIKEIAAGGEVGCDYACAAGRNVAGKVQPLRFSLTDEEIERYQTAGRLVTLAVEETAAATRPGDTELDTIGRLYHICRKTELDVVSAFCTSDERIYNYRHAIPTVKPVQERVQFGGNMRYKGLTVCLTRYVNFVPVTEELKKQYIDNVKIDCTFIHNSKPGNSYQVPLLAGQKMYDELGYKGEFDLHHQGGPIGYAPRDYRIGFTHDGIIPKNQAFCWNPSITGTKSEDTVIYTDNGPLFVTYPIIFPSITVEVEGTSYTRAYILEK